MFFPTSLNFSTFLFTLGGAGVIVRELAIGIPFEEEGIITREARVVGD